MGRIIMYYTIYKITNVINNKIYIGKHQTEIINDSYYGSGRSILAAIKKYGKENFKKEILFVFDNECQMNEKELEIITEEFVSRRDTYNLGIGGEGGPHFKGKKFSAESIEKMLKSRQGYTHSLETREKLGNANKNRVWKKSTLIKMSESAKRRFSDPKNRKQISSAMKKYHSDKCDK